MKGWEQVERPKRRWDASQSPRERPSENAAPTPAPSPFPSNKPVISAAPALDGQHVYWLPKGKGKLPLGPVDLAVPEVLRVPSFIRNPAPRLCPAVQTAHRAQGPLAPQQSLGRTPRGAPQGSGTLARAPREEKGRRAQGLRDLESRRASELSSGAAGAAAAGVGTPASELSLPSRTISLT